MSRLLLLAGLVYLVKTKATEKAPPEQVHLSFGEVASSVVVTWVTQNYTSDAFVQYGIGNLTDTVQGTTNKFVDGGSLHRVLYIHSATLTGLKPFQNYVYICGGQDGWSNQFNFWSSSDDMSWSPRLAILGDLGWENGVSTPFLAKEAQAGHFDAILHVGDFAYDFYEENGTLGDKFMRAIESYAAYAPYMTAVGNHENAYNFSHYRNRFVMPGGDGTGMYFSWNLGPAHFISFSSEVYYFYITRENIQAQYTWLEADLKAANAQRDIRPWIIVMAHKPMYCSNSDQGELCENLVNPVRYGVPLFPPSLEDLFYRYGVDLQFYGHEHSYERLLPVYNLKVCNGSAAQPYVNPKAPVHIVTGSAGSREGRTYFDPKVFPWSGFHSSDYGYTRMIISNATHLYLEQVSIDQMGSVIDKMWLVKDEHGPTTFNC